MGWDAKLTGNTDEGMRAKQYNDAASSLMGDAAVDATGLITTYGTLESAAALGWDGARTVAIATGSNPDTVPPSATDW